MASSASWVKSALSEPTGQTSYQLRVMERLLPGLAAVCSLAALVVGLFPLTVNDSQLFSPSTLKLVTSTGAMLALAALTGPALVRSSRPLAAITYTFVSCLAAFVLVSGLVTDLGAGKELGLNAGSSDVTLVNSWSGQVYSLAFWTLLISAWLLAWAAVDQLAELAPRRALLRYTLGVVVPLLFGLWILIIWECLTRYFDVPQVLLPAPSLIAERFGESSSILWADFKQTFLKSVLIGWSVGCLAGFVIAVLVDRSPFLKRGLLPVGNLISALPIVGLAPIMVMWFGFDWQSKAAVVIVMTFFPMLVNTVAGLSASSAMQRDLMKTYAADYWQSLFKLRLPQAMPFIFNALKINSTLALIGAIVAEFFGTPIVGMGFRISTEVGRMNVDMVWAEIAVAAVAGSSFYGLLALIERFFTFWHPSVRSRVAAR